MPAAPSFFDLATPRDMLEKAKRELVRIEGEMHIDNVYNFYVTAYHIQDYVRKADPSRIAELERFLAQQDLKDCRDLCDKGKHLKLTKKGRPDPQAIVYDNVLSGNTPLGSMKFDGGLEWVLITADGRYVDVISLALSIINHWDKFLSLDEKNAGEKE
ncbi:hypothetical protein [Hydrogenophaga pseudoflava]|uniref:hypothetical protein n=1 Tax=Hydrogenophaga pseudoflava TaxID=47421 RepID=UPI00105747D2|nr:hypothetical protein [Hydrogenophaga pseudoflava]